MVSICICLRVLPSDFNKTEQRAVLYPTFPRISERAKYISSQEKRTDYAQTKYQLNDLIAQKSTISYFQMIPGLKNYTFFKGVDRSKRNPGKSPFPSRLLRLVTRRPCHAHSDLLLISILDTVSFGRRYVRVSIFFQRAIIPQDTMATRKAAAFLGYAFYA